MNTDFDRLSDGLLTNFSHSNRDIHISVLDNNNLSLLLVFKEVLSCTINYSRGNIIKDNEIWKVEEIVKSDWINNVFEKSGIYWKEQTLANSYRRTKSTLSPSDIRHFVVFSDYIDIEIICNDYCILSI